MKEIKGAEPINADYLIKCEDVSLSYNGNLICSEIGFTLRAGDYLCIVGENGSGKSTLVKALVGLKEISGGSVEFGGGFKRSEAGYLPQQTAAQNDFPASVREIVLSGQLNKCRFRPFYSKAQRAAADGEMKRLGVWEIRKKSFSELSGGQRQRVLLARALCATSKLLILDEPAAGLDPIVTHELYHIIADINKSGVSVVMVSHDIACAVRYATHILHLQKTPLFFGTASAYAESDIGRKFLDAQPCDVEPREKTPDRPGKGGGYDA